MILEDSTPKPTLGRKTNKGEKRESRNALRRSLGKSIVSEEKEQRKRQRIERVRKTGLNSIEEAIDTESEGGRCVDAKKCRKKRYLDFSSEDKEDKPRESYEEAIKELKYFNEEEEQEPHCME